MRALKKGRKAPGQAPLLDLCETGWLGGSLVQHLIEQAPSRILVEEGPRGYALSIWLQQALRDQGIEIPVLSPLPPVSSPDRERGDALSRPLESLLAGAPRPLEAGETVQVDSASAKQDVIRMESLASKTRFSPGLVHLLPFLPGPDLEPRLEQTVERIASEPSAFRPAGVIPYFVTGPPMADPPCETRLLPSWWGVLPGDAYPKRVRDLFRELIRLLCPERMFLFMALENHALAGIDLYHEGLMGRFEPRPSPPCRKMGKPLIIGVCGIDGSGKSSHVQALEEFLRGKGLKVKRHKIYRHGVFHETVTDLTRQCAEGRNLHLWRIQRIVKAFDSVKYFYAAIEEDLKTHDVLLFDRYVYTHFAAGAGRYHHDPFTRELLSVFPPADRIYLMDVPTDEALSRIGERDEKTVDENPYMLSRFRHALLDQGGRNGFLILDARRPFEENRKRILEDAARLIEQPGGKGDRDG
jgi:dTMP kinase